MGDGSRILSHSFLAIEVVNLATSKTQAQFVVAAMAFRSLHGLSVILCEVLDDSENPDSILGKLKNVSTRVSTTIGFPLFATQIAYNAVHEIWMPILNLAVPAVDLVMYYAMDERPFDDEVFQVTKLISVGCIVYAALKTDETLGYIAAVAYILAELAVHNDDYGLEGWCITSAIGDYLSTLIVVGSLFGYSRAELT